MRLMVYTDYALRLLMYLALKEPEPATIAEVATRLQVSKNHLMKVAYQLGLAGYVRTQRGRSGGLRLARPPAEIRLGDVVRHTESDMALVPCFAPIDAPCAFLPDCGLRMALKEALAAFTQVLDQHSLAGLVERSGAIRDLLRMDHGPFDWPAKQAKTTQRRRKPVQRRVRRSQA
jgi:Rrf2 family nitric oxide-sensitive transcriptional repressor